MGNEPKTTYISSDAIPVFLLIMLVVGLFGKVIFSGESLFGSDFIFQFYPWKKFLYDTIRTDGSLPFWTPYLFSGTPFIANIQASMFYPLGFLYYLMPTEMAYLYSTMLHFSLAAVFMYMFARSLGVSRSGAFVAGFLFTFNGYFVAHTYAGHLSFVQNYVWIPLIFFLVYKFVLKRRLEFVLGAGLVLGIQILGGFPQIAFYTILGVLIFSCYMVIVRCLGPQSVAIGFIETRVRYLASMAIGAALVVIIGFSLSAIQVLPTYEFLQVSTRSGGVSYEFAVMDSLPPINLITFLIPEIFGNPARGTFWSGNASWQFWEFCAYLGVVPILLVLFSIRRLLADRMGVFFVLLTLMALFLSFGKYNPLYPLIYRLPGFDSFRIPAQILFLYAFSVAILTGKALDSLKEIKLRSSKYKPLVICILALVLGSLAWVYLAPDTLMHMLRCFAAYPEANVDILNSIQDVVRKAILISCAFALGFSILFYLYHKERIKYVCLTNCMIVLCVIDIAAFSFPMIQTVDIDSILKMDNIIGPIVEDREFGRGMVSGCCVIANAGLWYNFRDIQGYDPLILSRYMEYINRSQGLQPNSGVVNMHYVQHIQNNLIRMLNVKYIVDCDRKTIINLGDPLPRAYIVHKCVEMRQSKILDFMMDQRFSPEEVLVLEKGKRKAGWVSLNEKPESGEEVRLSIKGTDELEAFVLMKAPGFLILSEIDYPGWRAFVDGQEKSILTGNYLFRTVFIEEGAHIVRFVFTSTIFKVGAVISVTCLVLTFTILSFCRRRCQKMETRL